jgi:hypothetical protein
MTKREPLKQPALGMKVFHEEIYNGKECMTIVGIRYDEVELEGDYSGGTHHTVGKSWFPITGLFRLRKVCTQVVEHGDCPLHNIHCSYPNCEPYLTSDSHYNNGVKINH